MSLARHRAITLDTAPLIYFLEGDPSRGPHVASLLRRARDGSVSLAVSVLTETELLVQPIRAQDEVRERAVRQLLDVPEIRVVEVSREIARIAADVRGRGRLRLADAVVVATAVVTGNRTVLGNDLDFRRAGDRIEYVHLDDLSGKTRKRRGPHG